ncbi:UDP-N-acetyl-D-glucosamine dehydrogenase, partial [Patescibacteria group bacterium]|nr:UDP-N-acetyl-D-glucosamine dehydrogenase [Patescibacteria group bacterium]
ANIEFFDPLVKEFNHSAKGGNNQRLKSIKYTPEILKNYDCVLILAAHSGFNYNEIAQKSATVVDTRNAIKSRKYKKVFHL